MSAASYIADLDAALRESGEDVRLQRVVIGPGGTQITVPVTVRMSIRRRRTSEISDGVAEMQAEAVMSPTQIAAAGWPGPIGAPAAFDQSTPRKGDQVISARGQSMVEFGDAVVIEGTVVRINMVLIGSA